jgi:transcriptional regulator with XRE-family HTH domain
MKLSDAMKEKGWNDQQLATEVKTNRSTITKIRNGSRRPSPDLALKISKALDGLVSPYELLYNSAA